MTTTNTSPLPNLHLSTQRAHSPHSYTTNKFFSNNIHLISKHYIDQQLYICKSQQSNQTLHDYNISLIKHTWNWRKVLS